MYVGPQGYPVWAIDKRRNVYAREGVSTNLPIGEKWTVIPDLHAKKLCISNNAVWLLRPSGKIYRRFGVTEKNPCGDYWKQMPGNLDLISGNYCNFYNFFLLFYLINVLIVLFAINVN